MKNSLKMNNDDKIVNNDLSQSCEEKDSSILPPTISVNNNVTFSHNDIESQGTWYIFFYIYTIVNLYY